MSKLNDTCQLNSAPVASAGPGRPGDSRVRCRGLTGGRPGLERGPDSGPPSPQADTHFRFPLPPSPRRLHTRGQMLWTACPGRAPTARTTPARPKLPLTLTFHVLSGANIQGPAGPPLTLRWGCFQGPRGVCPAQPSPATPRQPCAHRAHTSGLLLTCHRGASRAAPENTPACSLTALRGALPRPRNDFQETALK